MCILKRNIPLDKATNLPIELNTVTNLCKVKERDDVTRGGFDEKLFDDLTSQAKDLSTRLFRDSNGLISGTHAMNYKSFNNICKRMGLYRDSVLWDIG